MSLDLKLVDIDHPLTFEESKLRQIEAHALIYPRSWLINTVYHSLVVVEFIRLVKDKKGRGGEGKEV